MTLMGEQAMQIAPRLPHRFPICPVDPLEWRWRPDSNRRSRICNSGGIGIRLRPGFLSSARVGSCESWLNAHPRKRGPRYIHITPWLPRGQISTGGRKPDWGQKHSEWSRHGDRQRCSAPRVTRPIRPAWAVVDIPQPSQPAGSTPAAPTIHKEAPD